jgi:hypothetical protein
MSTDVFTTQPSLTVITYKYTMQIIEWEKIKSRNESYQVREAILFRDLPKVTSVHQLNVSLRQVEDQEGICRSILPGTRVLSVLTRPWTMPSPVGTEIGRSGCATRRRSSGDQLGCDAARRLVAQLPSLVGDRWSNGKGQGARAIGESFLFTRQERMKAKQPNVLLEYITNDTGVRIVSWTWITDISNNLLDRIGAWEN